MKRPTPKESVERLKRKEEITWQVAELLGRKYGDGIEINVLGILTLIDAGLGADKVFEVLEAIRHGRELGVEVFQ